MAPFSATGPFWETAQSSGTARFWETPRLEHLQYWQMATTQPTCFRNQSHCWRPQMTFAAMSVLNTQSMVEVGAVETSGVSRLKNDDASQVLSFLSVRPVETVFMAGLIY